MKKILTPALALCLIFSLAGCQQNKVDNRADSISRKDDSGDVTGRLTEESNIKMLAETESTSMVMVNGSLYYDTGKESRLTERFGTMDGKITSAVDESETPAVNNQSNFGTGYGYQYGEDGTIEVLCDDKWIVFEQRWLEYTYDDSGNGVKFSFKYPESWKLTEERPYDGDETQEGSSMSSGISFQFLNPDSDYDTDEYLIIASLVFPFEVDESLFESEPFETDAGLAATKFTRELDNRIYSYYIFGDGVTVPQYTAIATMSVTNYELLKHDMEAVTKTLKILTDE